jgi:hypothetical protein
MDRERRCCVCGKPVGERDVVLAGMGGAVPIDRLLYVHREDCTGRFLLFLQQRAARLKHA